MPIQIRFTFTVFLAVLLAGCASGSNSLSSSKPLSSAKSLSKAGNNNTQVLDHRENKRMLWVGKPKEETIDPAFALSKDLPVSLFYTRGGGNKDRPVNISKRNYKRAIANADSGHGYDAFIAALAYVSGYYDSSNWRNASGQDYYEYRYYMKKAASLGWPEANLVMFACSRHSMLDRYAQKVFWVGCYGRGSRPKMDVDMTSSVAATRMFLFQAMIRGNKFDRNFEYKGKVLPGNISMTGALSFWRADMESRSVLASVQGTGQNPMFPASTAAKRCKINLPYMLKKAREYDEPGICQGGSESRYVHYTEKLSCPGAGYNDVRDYLEGCMAFSSTEEDWGYFFAKRMQLYHPLEDKELKIFDVARTHYQKTGDVKKLASVNQLREQAAQTTMQNKDVWDKQRAAATARARAFLARRDAEREAKRLQRIQDEREAAIAGKQRRAREAAESAQVWKDFNPIGDTFNDDIDRMKNETMRNINAQQRRTHRSSGNSSSSYDRSETSSRPDIHQRPAPRIPTPLCKQPPLPILGRFCPQQIVNNKVVPPSAECLKGNEGIAAENKARYAEWEANEINKCPKGGKGGGRGIAK